MSQPGLTPAMLFCVLSFLLPSASPINAENNILMTCKSHQVMSLRNYVTSSWVISQYSLVNGSLMCFLHCLQDVRCVSFLYSDVINHCRLLAIVKAPEDMTSAADGYRYYDTCRANGYYGAQCNVDGDCRLVKTRCFRFRCRCQEGYSFDPAQAKCVAHCSSYGQEFEAIPDYYINANNKESISGLDAEACLQRCLQATKYTCITIDVRTAPDPSCSTASVTKQDVPVADWLYQGGWVTVHYQRHCSV